MFQNDSLLLLLLLFSVSIPEGGFKNWWKWLKGYHAQSVQSGTGRLSCSRTALKRCTSTKVRWYKWLVSLVSPEIEEFLLPRSFRSRMADTTWIKSNITISSIIIKLGPKCQTIVDVQLQEIEVAELTSWTLRHAKLVSNYPHRHTSTQFLQIRCAFNSVKDWRQNICHACYRVVAV